MGRTVRVTLERDSRNSDGRTLGEPLLEFGILRFAVNDSHRTIEGGIGHSLPQEAPEPFVDAIIEVRNLNA
jgi:hypothetical protein